ncbi:ferric reductase-like transmembrane domain-containing protein [uncultured Cohaesibacter sp.]|uniref:sulfite oxidase heme-binding subunit YedZ n=1 Tax=uncultured Cohaesibacter sp. TaxID=1002546 RepID=UPI0029C646B1|nr:ferric reductase-like transmembrane domain-containing protein [uncultured Cohaesibacter sp.]
MTKTMTSKSGIKAIIDSPYFIWLLLTIPAIPMISDALSGTDLHRLLHPTGEFAARFLILSLMLTPLKLLFPKSGFVFWLMRRRRYIGVAAFGYALLHTLCYVVDLGTLSKLVADLSKLGIIIGWLAFIIFIPLALTSNDLSIRKLGPRQWKSLQRFAYIAAMATLVHWLLESHHAGAALVNFAPLILLELYRLWHTMRPSHGHPSRRPSATLS